MTTAGAQTPFITFEGGEGVGKSTQVARLAGRLRRRGIEVVTTREPGGAPKAEAIRTLLLSGRLASFGPAAEAIMFGAARLDHVRELIRPALARGAWVVSDRFTDSTRAYQGAAARVELALIDALETATVGSTRPDLTLILDLPEREGRARAQARRGLTAPDRFEQLDEEFHERLRAAFLAIAAADARRCIVIDASRGADNVEADIWQAVTTRLLGATRTGDV